MTCKDCLHFKVCYEMASANEVEEFNTLFANKCEDFTASSEWVHLPCKVGDYVYCIFENKVRLASVLSFYIDKVGIIVDLKISLNGELPTAPSAVCHIDRDSYSDNDIYLTSEEAEKALEEKK